MGFTRLPRPVRLTRAQGLLSTLQGSDGTPHATSSGDSAQPAIRNLQGSQRTGALEHRHDEDVLRSFKAVRRRVPPKHSVSDNLRIGFIVGSRDSPADAGVYLFALLLSRSRTIAVGSLGRIHFEKGWYMYAGSARRGLSSRLSRHERRSGGKVIRWHIDYLRAHTQTVRAFPIHTRYDLECQLAEDVRIISDGLVPRFGCSDCSCPSHLFRFSDEPSKNPGLVALLSRYRYRF